MSDKHRADWDPVSDEDEVARAQPGRPNSYWAEQRAKQALSEAREASLGYGADYRAVRQTPHGGAQSVRPEDTIGDYDLCWCGEPADHDWPGKNKGRKHPRATLTTKRKDTEMPQTTEAPHIERKHLRTYHEDLVDVIIRAVNDYGVRYRLSNNGCILYPPDGTQPLTIYARNTDRQARQARKWFIEHVIGTEGAKQLIKDQSRILDDMDLREKARLLAEKLNSEEHEVPPEVPKETSDERRARKAREAQERADEMAAAEAARREAEAAEIHVRETEEEQPGWANPPDTWGPYQPKYPQRSRGPSPVGYERYGDTNKVRCTVCGWEGTTSAMSGHSLNHDEERQAALWGEESQNKKRATHERQRIETNVEEAIAALYKALGRQAPKGDDPRVKDLEKQLAQSQSELTQALMERDTAIKTRDDVQARLDLLREALQV